jgi:hypothetical protein
MPVHANRERGFLSKEWLWVAVICAAPFVAFGLLEAIVIGRRRRAEAIARRSKSKVQSGRWW